MTATELKPALELALALEHAPMGVLMLCDGDAGALHPVVAVGLTDEQSRQFDPQRPGVGPVGVAFSEHRRVCLTDVLADVDHDAGPLHDIAARIGFRGVDIVPVTLRDGQSIGAFAALFRSAHRPRPRSAQLTESCAQLIALALDHARLRVHAERERENADARARARAQFLARMSHELRTPLQSITGYIELMRVGLPEQLSERQADLLDRVRKSELILISVIDDVVTFAGLEAGRVAYALQPVLAQEAMATSETIVSPLARRRGIRLEVDPGNPLFAAQADAGKLNQVLINLLTNAVKYTPSGGMVRLSARCDDAAIYFDVADTGPGIPADKLDDVFLPYVRVNHNSLDGIDGSGLGLAISREFTSGMGGALTATSDLGRGSVFTVRLLRHLQEHSNVDSRAEAHIPPPT